MTASGATPSEVPMWPSHEEVEAGAQAGPQSSTLATAMDMPALRQSTRTKKLSQKAEENKQGIASSSQAQQQEGDKDGEQNVFCLCRKGDDGKPMVYCAECKDWFHFKCVGLTKKSASDLSVFVCPPCTERTGKTIQTASASNETSQQDDLASEKGKSDTSPMQPPLSTPTLPSPKRKRDDDDAATKRSKGSDTAGKEQRRSSSARAQSGPLTKKPSSPSQTPVAAQGARKTSMSSGPSTSASSSVLKTGNDTLRRHATEQFTIVFREIFSEAKSSDADGEKEDKAKLFADKFESALFDANHEASSVSRGKVIRTAGKEYRDKLRSFLFNLKDKSNKTLRARIASEEIDAARLATMTSEELANDEIRKEVERRKRENLEQSILKRDNAVPLRKVTHKGEVDIEVDAPPSLQHREHDFYAREAERIQAAADAKAADIKEATAGATKRSESPALPAGSPTSEQSTPVPRLRQDSTSASFDFDNVWSGEGHAKVVDDTNTAEGSVAQDAEDKKDAAIDNDDNATAEATDPAADNFIDSFLGMQDNAEETAATGIVAENDKQLPLPTRIKWRGSINMPDEGAFTGNVRQIAGRLLNDDEWNALLHTPNALIEGRLPSDVAMPYLLQSQIAIRTELVALSMESSWEPDAVPAALSSSLNSEEASQKAFDRLISYFNGRRRYGVVQCNPSARGSLVKDFYIAALPAQEPAPEWLANMDGFANLAREKDLFLLVAVLFKPMATNKSLEPSASRSPAERDAANKGVSVAPASIANALAPGSSTLQDLLKAVGGGSNRSPAQGTPVPYTPPQHGDKTPTQASASETSMSQPGPAPAGMPSASQMQALSEMPKPQLEDMLTKNPNLVDNLLKALNNGRSNSPAASAGPPPPGPPPGPPPARPPIGTPQYPAPNTSEAGYNGAQNYQGYQSPGYAPHAGNYGPPQGPYGQQQPYIGYPGPNNQGYYQQGPYAPQHQGPPGHFGQRPPPSGPSHRGRGGSGGGGFRGRGRY